ncbi:MAG: hypothetical protein ACTSPE_07845 [Candidatus Thorarchaeota archaeon]
MSQLDRRRFTYYGVFVIGLALAGLYFLYLLDVVSLGDFFGMLVIGSGAAFVGITLLISFSRSRPLRLILTILSGASGGVHYYLNTLAITPAWWGTIMFMLLGVGLLLTYSTFSWLRE